MARGGGFIAFGHTLSDPTWKMPWPGTGPYGFIQPNLRNEFLGNTVMEGLRAEHQSSPLGTGALGVQLQFGGHAPGCSPGSSSTVCVTGSASIVLLSCVLLSVILS